TAQILPVKPKARVRSMATAHSLPPMKAMDLGERKRVRRVVMGLRFNEETTRPPRRPFGPTLPTGGRVNPFPSPLRGGVRGGGPSGFSTILQVVSTAHAR